jgi:hypothetical protein
MTTTDETTHWTPGTPIRITSPTIPSQWRGRTGWIATTNTQHLPDGRTYTEIGVTWAIQKDWEHATADTWFRTDELETR